MEEKNPKKIPLNKKIIALLLCVAILVVSLYSCSKRDKSNTEIQQGTEISVDVIDPKNDFEESIAEQVEDGTVNDIYSMVCSTVQYKLSEAGFQTEIAVAQTIENEDYSGLGLAYYDPTMEFFEGNEFQAVGFVEVVNETDDFYDVSKNESIIAVTSMEDGSSDEIQKICTYNYEDIGSSHFVYQGKYVTYYQQTPMRVVYSVQDNNSDSYDLSLGSLYDFDNKEYIYDESIFGEYVMHSAVDLFSEEDYQALEEYLKKMSDEQLKAGYYVTDFSVVYISPESIQAYLDSEEEDTFFGYSVDELTEAFGKGTALRYTENGFEAASELSKTEEYNWKSFLTKVGIGAGIIIVGAVLTPVTGGASFGCALITITEYAAGFAITSAVGTVAFETVKGMIDGKTLKDALLATKNDALDSFANSFLIAAAVASIGVTSGIIKPTACFRAGTPITIVANDGSIEILPIEQVTVGDSVLSRNMEDGLTEPKKVSGIFVNSVSELVRIEIGEDIIEASINHPFYSLEYNDWIAASSLKQGDILLTMDGREIVVSNVEIQSLMSPVEVYNFTVEDNHTYYVGESGILVHNKCDPVIKQLRKEARDNTWKEEIQAIKNGTSKYNWTTAQKKEILENGLLKGYDVTHIIDVQRLKGTVNQEFIASTKNTVILERKTQHFAAHMYNWNNYTNTDVIVEFLPWAAEKVEYMLSIVA